MLEQATSYLRELCLVVPHRRVGSSGNRAATDLFAEATESFGFQTECPEFGCIDWTQGGAHLTSAGEAFVVYASPYTLGCEVSAPLAVVSTIEDLEVVEGAGKTLLLRGDLAGEQLMPKSFQFYNPERHQQIIRLLETKGPVALVAATTRNPELAGALYPFPLIEDGDFDIPSVYMTDDEGNELARHAGNEVSVHIVAERIPASGCNVIARKRGQWERRIVLFAHIDAKDNTPGATDNATGVVILLLLAELLAEYSGGLGIEIVALNGEDYYSAPGEMQYLATNAGRFDEIALGINLDGAGYLEGHTAYSLYGCPPDIAAAVHKVFSGHPELVEGPPWYQSDHGLFTMNNRPALAITSEAFATVLAEIAHTPKDSPDIVDTSKLVVVAVALRDLLLDLDQLFV